MDIFTTQYAKLLQTPITASRLKVKGLVKDAKARALNEENDHIYGETDNYVDNAHLPKQEQHENDEHRHKEESVVTEQGVDTGTKEVIEPESDESKLTYPKRPRPQDKKLADNSSNSKSDNKNDEDDTPHLDLFV